MTKKKPSPQNRVWEKERRERLNKGFDKLSTLLPEYEPSTVFSKIDIIQKSIQFIEKLQKKIKDILETKDDTFKKHVEELELRLSNLLSRNKDLADLLRKSKINIPPCKFTGAVEEECDEKKDKAKKKVVKKEEYKKKSVEEETSTVINNKSASSPTIVTEAPPAVSSSEIVSTSPEIITISKTQFSQPISIPNTCLVVANNQIVGTLQKTNNVNVTPALLSTPIMTTSVLISNNGNLLVQQPSSLLIVSNDNINEKIKCKKIGKVKKKISIKSIDLIPGKIVNGKIPIPPLKKSPEIKKKVKKKRKIVEKDEGEPKKIKVDENIEEKPKENEVETKVDDHNKENENENENKKEDLPIIEDAMNLEQSDLSNDIFEALQVPGATNQESLSPTAAYLMNFPLVAGGKVSGNHEDSCTEDEDDPDDPENHKKSANLNDSSMILDNFSSFFNTTLYPETTQVSTPTNYSTIYQSIDNIIENKPKVKAPEFTFTLTSTTASQTNALSTFDYRNSTNFLYPNVSSTSTKPPIMPDFTFSLTSATSTPPKTVQSHYTNSANFTSTITTPSYETNNYNKNRMYSTNYHSFSYDNVVDNKVKNYNLNTEQPATSFTFSLTSTTKTVPKYSTSNKQNYLKVEDDLLKTPTKNPLKTPPKQKPVAQYSSSSKYDVNWMASQDYKCSNTPDFPILPPLDFTTPTSSFYTNFDLNRKSDIYFAHPPGEDNLTWSPNKITNILNDTATHLGNYFPTTLPNLNGDLALHTVNNTNVNLKPKKNVNHESNFLSVRQLVDQDKSKNICSQQQQKTFNNNYSAESLISSNKKENYYNYTSNVENPFQFDYNNYNNNYNCNQNFVTSFMDNNYSATGQQNYYNSPNNSAVNKGQNQYSYQHHDTPYYLPDTKKNSQNCNVNPHNNNVKVKKNKNYDFPPPVPPVPPSNLHPPGSTSSSGYFSVPAPPSSHPIADDSYNYHNFNYSNPIKNHIDKSTSSLGNNVNAIHLGHYIGNNNNTSNSTNTGNSLTNFNLSTICPEINEKAVVRQHHTNSTSRTSNNTNNHNW